MVPLTPQSGLPWTGSCSCDSIEYRHASTWATIIFRKVRRKLPFARVGVVQLCVCLPFPVTARSKAWVWGRSFAGTAGSNLAEGHGCLSLVSVLFCQVEFSETSWSYSRGVVPSVVRLCVWSINLKNEAVMALVGPQRHRKKYGYIYIYIKETSWKTNPITQAPDRPQHGCPAACVIAQQCSSVACVPLLFHYRMENFSTLSKNATISISLLFFTIA